MVTGLNAFRDYFADDTDKYLCLKRCVKEMTENGQNHFVSRDS